MYLFFSFMMYIYLYIFIYIMFLKIQYARLLSILLSQEALKNHDSWMEDVSNTLQQMQEKEENLTEDRLQVLPSECKAS